MSFLLSLYIIDGMIINKNLGNNPKPNDNKSNQTDRNTFKDYICHSPFIHRITHPTQSILKILIYFIS